MFLSEVLSFVDKETSTALLVFVLKWNKNRIIDGNDDNEGGLGDKRVEEIIKEVAEIKQQNLAKENQSR